jgi:hypothetical protein
MHEWSIDVYHHRRMPNLTRHHYHHEMGISGKVRDIPDMAMAWLLFIWLNRQHLASQASPSI